MSSWRRLFREFDVAAAGYLLGWKVSAKLPEPLVRGLFNLGADLISHGRSMDPLRRNLSRIVGPENVTGDLVRASMRSYARYWREVFRLPQLVDDPALAQQLASSVVGGHFLDESLASGRGVILTLPPFRQLRETVENGGIVCLMGDRDLKQTGVACEMLGEPTSLPTGSVQLALKTGAALHVGHCWYPKQGGWGFSVSQEVEVTDLKSTLQRVADLFGANLAAHPQDWHMLQPQWTMDIEASRKRLRRDVGRGNRT